MNKDLQQYTVHIMNYKHTKNTSYYYHYLTTTTTTTTTTTATTTTTTTTTSTTNTSISYYSAQTKITKKRMVHGDHASI